jgi:uncharacterized protein (DUF58 family)
VKTNFAKLNHVLIPTRKVDRDRLRRTRTGIALRPFFMLFARLSREGRTMAVVTFIAGGLSFDIARSESYILFVALLGLISASLLWSRLFTLRGVRANVIAPRLVTKNQPVDFAIEIRNEGPTPWQSVRVEGPFLPWDGRWIGTPPGVASLAPGEKQKVALTARFVALGEHHLDPFSVVALVPMGFAQGPALDTASCRFVVVPTIARVVHLSAPRRSAQQSQGASRASRTAASMDLHGVRPYRAGDQVRDLHAKTWARVGYPVVREYEAQQAPSTGVIVDATGTTGDQFEALLSLSAGVVAKLSTGESLTRLFIVGATRAPLEIGRGAAPLDSAMEQIGMITAPLPANITMTANSLLPYLDGVSSVLVLEGTIRPGDLARYLRQRGVEATSIVVGTGAKGTDGTPAERPASDPGAFLIEPSAVLAMEAIAL